MRSHVGGQSGELPLLLCCLFVQRLCPHLLAGCHFRRVRVDRRTPFHDRLLLLPLPLLLFELLPLLALAAPATLLQQLLLLRAQIQPVHAIIPSILRLECAVDPLRAHDNARLQGGGGLHHLAVLPSRLGVLVLGRDQVRGVFGHGGFGDAAELGDLLAEVCVRSQEAEDQIGKRHDSVGLRGGAKGLRLDLRSGLVLCRDRLHLQLREILARVDRLLQPLAHLALEGAEVFVLKQLLRDLQRHHRRLVHGAGKQAAAPVALPAALEAVRRWVV